MVDETGETPIDQILDDVIERIGKGEVIADMSDATQNALAGLYARNTSGVKSKYRKNFHKEPMIYAKRLLMK